LGNAHDRTLSCAGPRAGAARAREVTPSSERFSLEEVPEEIRGELCASCGKCCRVMIFDDLPVNRRDPLDRSWIEWIGLHGGSAKVVRGASGRTLTVTAPVTCLKRIEDKDLTRCGIYETRPLICRRYNCLEDDAIGDTAWKRYIREQRSRRKGTSPCPT